MCVVKRKKSQKRFLVGWTARLPFALGLHPSFSPTAFGVYCLYSKPISNMEHPAWCHRCDARAAALARRNFHLGNGIHDSAKELSAEGCYPRGMRLGMLLLGGQQCSRWFVESNDFLNRVLSIHWLLWANTVHHQVLRANTYNSSLVKYGVEFNGPR